MNIKDKIRYIKLSRLPSSERLLLSILYNLKEVRKWESDSIVIYKYRNKTIFEYDIDLNILYMNNELYKKIEKHLDDEIGEFDSFLSIHDYITEKFNSKNIKRNTLDRDKEYYYVQYRTMLNNNLFNSITGKCKKVHLVPNLVP